MKLVSQTTFREQAKRTALRWLCGIFRGHWYLIAGFLEYDQSMPVVLQCQYCHHMKRDEA